MAVLRPPSSSGALLNAFSALLNGTSLYVLNHYAASMALATELAMDPLRAHIHLSLGRLHRRERQLEQARTELSQALAAYRSMEMPFWKDTAEQEISELGAH